MNQDHFEEIFGSTDNIMAHITAEDVFDPEVLDMIDRLGNRLLQEVPYADSLTSLMNLSIPIGTEERFEASSPFEDGIPTDPKELAETKAFILTPRRAETEGLSQINVCTFPDRESFKRTCPSPAV